MICNCFYRCIIHNIIINLSFLLIPYNLQLMYLIVLLTWSGTSKKGLSPVWVLM